MPISTDERIRRLFNQGCTQYGLLQDGDRILVALSGGKDSLYMTRMLAARARIYKPHIMVEAAHVVMDNIPYETSSEYLETFCQECGIGLHILHTCFDESTDRRKTRCFLCAWNRRRTLFQYATDNGFNKVALGHHMDDILVTMLMNMNHEGRCESMKPMMEMEHYPISVIRPMCLVHEQLIREGAEELGFEKQKALCPYETVTQRARYEDLFHQMERINPEARYNLWRCLGYNTTTSSCD